VSRTFGDIEAKNPKYGGNPNVVIAKPDIKSFVVEPHHDFVCLACDGVFEKLSNEDVVNGIW
jgi:protein phosphatase 2C family protein 2/3